MLLPKWPTTESSTLRTIRSMRHCYEFGTRFTGVRYWIILSLCGWSRLGGVIEGSIYESYTNKGRFIQNIRFLSLLLICEIQIRQKNEGLNKTKITSIYLLSFMDLTNYCPSIVYNSIYLLLYTCNGYINKWQKKYLFVSFLLWDWFLLLN